jgi:hypothetical protein
VARGSFTRGVCAGLQIAGLPSSIGLSSRGDSYSRPTNLRRRAKDGLGIEETVTGLIS